jgi:hypothetical protein
LTSRGYIGYGNSRFGYREIPHGDDSGGTDISDDHRFCRFAGDLRAARLGIADLLKDGPKGTAELAKSAGADDGALYRLLRFLASQGIFAECDNGRFKLTSLGEFLQTGAPGSMRDRVRPGR